MSTVCSDGLTRGEDDFGKADAQTAVMVDTGVAEVFEGKVGEPLGGGLGSQGTAFDLGEQFQQIGRGHGSADSLSVRRGR